MRYELWDLTTRNMTGGFVSEAAALEAIRAAARHGEAYVEAFSLIGEDSRRRSTTVARGTELVQRAFGKPPSLRCCARRHPSLQYQHLVVGRDAGARCRAVSTTTASA